MSTYTSAICEIAPKLSSILYSMIIFKKTCAIKTQDLRDVDNKYSFFFLFQTPVMVDFSFFFLN
jgi:hypothetical protein